MLIKEKLDIVLQMVLSENNNLYELARMTGCHIFRFYERADLSGLDLSGQDLTGLNFAGADLTKSNLNNIKFNAGAFNGAKIDDRFLKLKDNFEFSLFECNEGLIQRIHMFAKFREGSIEYISELLKISFGRLAYLSLLSENTIRNARYGKFLSMDSISKIFDGVKRAYLELGIKSEDELSSILFRPMVQFSDVLPNGTRRNFIKEDVLQIVKMATLLQEETGRYNVGAHMWRDSPSILSWLITTGNLLEYTDKDVERAAYDLRGVITLTEDQIESILKDGTFIARGRR